MVKSEEKEIEISKLASRLIEEVRAKCLAQNTENPAQSTNPAKQSKLPAR